MGNGCCTKEAIITSENKPHEEIVKILYHEDEYHLNYYINFKTLRKYIESCDKVTISAYLINAKSIPNFRSYIIASEDKKSKDIEIKKTDLENEIKNIQICDNYEKCLEITKDKDNEFLILTENLVNGINAQKVLIIKENKNYEIVFDTQQYIKFVIKPVFLFLIHQDENFNPKTIIIRNN